MSVSEGKVCVSVPGGQVFYNPTQVFNRDFSLLAISAFAQQRTLEEGRKIRLLEALAASGLRSVRYSRELPTNKPFHIVANDISSKAVESIESNIAANPPAEPHSIAASHADAIALMYSLYGAPREEKFDIVDLDPYGSPAMFVPAALAAVRTDGGLLCVTCTDLLVLCGNQTDTCHARYGAVPVRAPYAHEMAIRICIRMVMSCAARVRLAATPIVSFFHAHYLRVFFRIEARPALLLAQPERTGMVFNCPTCSMFFTQPLADRSTKRRVRGGVEKTTSFVAVARGLRIPSLRSDGRGTSGCPFCGSVLHVGGPVWLGSMHEEAFVRTLRGHFAPLQESAVLASSRVIEAILQYQLHEAGPVVSRLPLFFEPAALAKGARCHAIPIRMFVSALASAGAAVGVSHTDPTGVRTDAAPELIAAVMRLWRSLEPVWGKGVSHYPPEGSAARRFVESVPAARISREELRGFIKGAGTSEDVVDTAVICDGNGALVSLTQAPEDEWLRTKLTTRAARLFFPNPERNWGPKKAAPVFRGAE
eukprot:gnl/Chilomastix_cuspidata/1129.p1 GENE.gnl/Chilomastix_cuspidata/1129~~gnl/Chilomastix_cuspidata/1129.p1  ORF type:complete len:536 (+),score=135.72 gnl/Chilomastix_cuspidata/1129:342-1949(+)